MNIETQEFEIVEGRYRLKVIKSDYGEEYPDDEAVMKKISGDGEEDVYVMESDSEESDEDFIDDEESDEDFIDDEESDDDINAGHYGHHKKYDELYVDLFDVKVTITDDFAILAAKFTLPAEHAKTDFAALNNGLSKVEFFTLEGESIFQCEKQPELDHSVWFSDRFIDQFDDQDLVTIHEGKKVWALKWSKPMPRGKDNGANQSSSN